MRLEEINVKLVEIADELSNKIAVLKKAEIAYQMRYYDLLLHSKMGNQQTRDAEALRVCMEEGLYDPYLDLKADVRSLQVQKECYLTISANLRALRFGGKIDEIMD